MYIAIDIGGTKTLVGAFTDDGELVKTEKIATNKDYELFYKDLTVAVDQVIDSRNDIKSIGVAAPGRIDYENSVVMRFGNLDWQNVDIKKRLLSEFGVDVSLENDANLGALGEATMGAGIDYHSVLYITISTGIGTGITIDKVIDPLLRKAEGGAMHYKHDGQLMKWEKFASGKAFFERYDRMGKDVGLDSEEDIGIWKEYARDLSLGFGSLIAIIQPDVIVVGGSMGEHLAKYVDFLVQDLEELKSPVVETPKIVKAEHPVNAVINGCYQMARQNV